MKDRLLILAGQDVHCKVVEAAKEMGVYTIVADYLVDSPAKKIADETSMVSILDVQAVVQLAKDRNVKGVMSFCNDPVCKVLQKVNETLGFPNIGTAEQVFKLTNKHAFKEMCRENGIDVIQEYKEGTDLDLIEYPVVVKPIDSRGSRGSAICRRKEELAEGIVGAKKESSDGTILIERFMEGCQDLTITYIIKDGKPYLISLGDRYPGRDEDNLSRQLSGTIQPSRYVDLYMDRVNDRVIRMIQNLGIRNAAVFMQGFVDGDTVRMYDPGIRFPGNEYERIFTKATGLNPMKSMICYFLTGELDDYNGKYEGSYDLNGLCAIQYMINVRAGKIAEYKGLEEIAKRSEVVHVSQKAYVGAVIENTGDIKHRVGEISVLCERSQEKMREIIEFIQEKLVIVDDKGENMIISPFNRNVVEEY